MSNCKIEGQFVIENSIISSNCHIKRNKEKTQEKIFLLGEGTKISL